MLSSRSVARQVFSPPTSLTSVFGMGTGGPSSSLTPTSSDLASLATFPPVAFGFRRELRIVSRFLLPKMKQKFHFGYLPGLTEKIRSRGFSVFRAIWSGDPCGNRTHVWGVRGPRLNLLTNGPRRRNTLRSFRFRVRPGGLPRKLHIASWLLLFKMKLPFHFEMRGIALGVGLSAWYTIRDSNPGHPD